MGKHVIGAYQTDEAAVYIVQHLKARGYLTEDISMIVNHGGNKNNLIRQTGAAVDIVNKEETLLEKFKHLFTGEHYTHDFKERLASVGISEANASSYASEVEAGKILVLINSNSPYDLSEESLASSAVTDETMVEGDEFVLSKKIEDEA